MTIKVGDKLPEAKFRVLTADGLQVKSTDDIFKGKKVALFAVPGAYTGTCHKMHLPSIFLNAYAIKDKGVDNIAIVSVNDAFVMSGLEARNRPARRSDLPRRRQRRIHQGDRPGAGRFRQRARHPLASLFDAGRRRCSEEAEPRGCTRQGRGFRRRYAARAAVNPFGHSGLVRKHQTRNLEDSPM